MRKVRPDKYITIDANAITAGTEEDAWTPTTGKRFILCGWELSVSAAASIIFMDGADVMHRTAKVAIDTPSHSPEGYEYRSSAVDNKLKLDVSANATVSGFVFGYEVNG